MQVRRSERNPQVWYVGDEVVQLLDGGPLCSCMTAYATLSDFGPPELHYVGCRHMRAAQEARSDLEEAEADEDIAAGRVKRYESGDDLLADLTRLGQELQAED